MDETSFLQDLLQNPENISNLNIEKITEILIKAKYILEDDDALYAEDFISFDYDTDLSGISYHPDTFVLDGVFGDLTDGSNFTDIQLNATNRSITISTEKIVSGRSYFKEIDLPAAINQDYAKARYTNGILEVRLKKIKEKGKPIDIE